MGGMIVQTMAIEHPERVADDDVDHVDHRRSVASARPTRRPSPRCSTPPPTDREGAIARSVQAVKAFGSKRYFDADRVAGQGRRGLRPLLLPGGRRPPARRHHRLGRPQPSASRALTTPTLVIHGCDDTLINPSGGERTAELVPGPKLLLLKDMGHDLPEPLWPFIVEVIGAHTRA